MRRLCDQTFVFYYHVFGLSVSKGNSYWCEVPLSGSFTHFFSILIL